MISVVCFGSDFQYHHYYVIWQTLPYAYDLVTKAVISQVIYIC